LGAFGVVLETFFSGISDLPFKTFLLLMQPIHLAIGFIEGLVTAAVVIFIWKARPEILEGAASSRPMGSLSIKRVLVGLLVVTVITAAFISWFASAHPDSLEWSIFNTSGKGEMEAPKKGIYHSLARLQERTAVLPDYGFKPEGRGAKEGGSWPAVESGTTVSGLVGGALTLVLAVFIGIALKKRKRST
jgi:cobalt/nickel transport system permease protein